MSDAEQRRRAAVKAAAARWKNHVPVTPGPRPNTAEWVKKNGRTSVHAYPTVELNNRLVQLAEQQGRTKASVLIDAITEYVDRYGTKKKPRHWQ